MKLILLYWLISFSTVNVNKLLFGEMKQAEREREKQAFKNKHLGEFEQLAARWRWRTLNNN